MMQFPLGVTLTNSFTSRASPSNEEPQTFRCNWLVNKSARIKINHEINQAHQTVHMAKVNLLVPVYTFDELKLRSLTR